MEYVIVGIAKSLKEALDLCQGDKMLASENDTNTNAPNLMYVTPRSKEFVEKNALNKATPGQLSSLDFQHIVDLIMERFEEENKIQNISKKVEKKKYIYVRKQNRIVKLPISSIFYVHVQGRYSIIFSELGKFILEMSLVELADKFPDIFLRSHRNYLVSSDMVQSIDLEDFQVHLVNGQSIPLSIRYKDKLLKEFRLLK